VELPGYLCDFDEMLRFTVSKALTKSVKIPRVNTLFLVG